MKTAIVPGSALEFGWEADVHLFASEHKLKIESTQDYQDVRELMSLLEEIDKLTTRIDALTHARDVNRKARDQLKLKLGWGKNRMEIKDGVPEL